MINAAFAMVKIQKYQTLRHYRIVFYEDSRHLHGGKSVYDAAKAWRIKKYV